MIFDEVKRSWGAGGCPDVEAVHGVLRLRPIVIVRFDLRNHCVRDPVANRFLEWSDAVIKGFAGDFQARNEILGRRKNCEPRLCDFRSEEHTSELQSLMRISYAVLCLKKKKKQQQTKTQAIANKCNKRKKHN